MQFPVDADLAVFVYTTGKIVFGSLPQLRRSVSSIPVHYQIEEVATAALTEKQSEFFAPYDQKLAAMNYWPVCTYRVTNYGHNLMRSYVNPAETSRCVVMIVETKLTVGSMKPVGSTSLMSFHTLPTTSCSPPATCSSSRSWIVRRIWSCRSARTSANLRR